MSIFHRMTCFISVFGMPYIVWLKFLYTDELPAVLILFSVWKVHIWSWIGIAIHSLLMRSYTLFSGLVASVD